MEARPLKLPERVAFFAAHPWISAALSIATVGAVAYLGAPRVAEKLHVPFLFGCGIFLVALLAAILSNVLSYQETVVYDNATFTLLAAEELPRRRPSLSDNFHAQYWHLGLPPDYRLVRFKLRVDLPHVPKMRLYSWRPAAMAALGRLAPAEEADLRARIARGALDTKEQPFEWRDFAYDREGPDLVDQLFEHANAVRLLDYLNPVLRATFARDRSWRPYLSKVWYLGGSRTIFLTCGVRPDQTEVRLKFNGVERFRLPVPQGET